MTPKPPAIVTSRFTALDGRRATSVPVSVQVPSGGLLIVQGGHRAGKTSLLLALTGRFARTRGRAEVLGLTLPKKSGQIRNRCAFVGPSVNPLDPDLRVHRQIAAQAALHSPWWRPWLGRKAHDRAVAELAEVVVGLCDGAASLLRESAIEPSALTAPMRARVDELRPLDQWLLSVGLAMTDSRELVAIDDVDALLDPADRQFAWAALFAATKRLTGITLVASCHSAAEPEELLWAQKNAETVRPATWLQLDAAADEQVAEPKEN